MELGQNTSSTRPSNRSPNIGPDQEFGGRGAPAGCVCGTWRTGRSARCSSSARTPSSPRSCGTRLRPPGRLRRPERRAERPAAQGRGGPAAEDRREGGVVRAPGPRACRGRAGGVIARPALLGPPSEEPLLVRGRHPNGRDSSGRTAVCPHCLPGRPWQRITGRLADAEGTVGGQDEPVNTLLPAASMPGGPFCTSRLEAGGRILAHETHEVRGPDGQPAEGNPSPRAVGVQGGMTSESKALGRPIAAGPGINVLHRTPSFARSVRRTTAWTEALRGSCRLRLRLPRSHPHLPEPGRRRRRCPGRSGRCPRWPCSPAGC